MSFLNTQARNKVKNLLLRLDESQFRDLVAELYVRKGCVISFDTASPNVDFVIEDTEDFTDDIFGTIGVTCRVLDRDVSYIDINSTLSSDLTELFDEYYFCTTAQNSIDSYTRKKLQSDDYADTWFTFKNYESICSLLDSYDNDYLVYVYYSVTPSMYENGISDEQYIKDRFELIGIDASDYAISRLSKSTETLRDINMVEKFVLSEAVGSGLIRNHINPIFDKKKFIHAAVQNGNPSSSTVNKNIF